MPSTLEAPQTFLIEDFLARERTKDLLRFTTAGSVDDGKSTLIGRLLYDSRNVYEDQIKSVTKASVNRTAGAIDFSLLTDGLRAEREQGITIDVAYRYFATTRRKFIIADTPGHEQYTRNMATGASTADLAIILIDARQGVLRQSRRHGYIASLLGIPRLVVAVNKMDLVDFDEEVFRAIETEFSGFLKKLGAPPAYFLPISALLGDNVVAPSPNTPWFHGPNLLEHLETVEIPTAASAGSFRFPVQRVVRPDASFRGYAGQVVSGSIRPGDAVYVLPAGRRTTVKSITTFDGDLDTAFAPMSVTLTLNDEIDISRGDLIAPAGNIPQASRHLKATVVWMHQTPLEPRKSYLVKHASQTVKAEIKSVQHRVNIHTLEQEKVASLELNSIGVVEIEAARPLFFDAYKQNRFTGSLIIIDPANNLTVGAGMILQPVIRERTRSSQLELKTGKVTLGERMGRYGNAGAIVAVGPRQELAELIERKLFDRGCLVAIAESEEAARTMESVGMIALLAIEPELALPADDKEAAAQVMEALEQDGVLLAGDLTGGEGI
ncbi:MAG TPA: sulfate adenylyltransferase subunit CysN [Bryobacteraceae bacterium]|jgi:sulfate adenylyltransferase large subunit